MKFAIVVFPGSNCDSDMFYAIKDELGEEAEYVWHTEKNLDKFHGIILPGGFSYGDYLRCGAIACFSNIINAVIKANNERKPILGVCNGFQILTELDLLPGVLLPNESTKFICQWEEIVVDNNNTMFTFGYEKGEKIKLPIAHGEGNYYCSKDTLKALKENNQIIFRYANNPNGSLDNIAGITNKNGNVLGMMPHPERAVSSLLGSSDGLKIFKNILQTWRKGICYTS